MLMSQVNYTFLPCLYNHVLTKYAMHIFIVIFIEENEKIIIQA